MFSLPTSIVSVLQPFDCLFTCPTLAHEHGLPAGTLLAQVPRTMGLSAERRFELSSGAESGAVFAAPTGRLQESS
ncbi:MAG: hypothetical protein KFB96_19635 [Thiocapsa sp.]|uniref:hypothetical protein n=1 Tax=Thiocapsa sp. TaxID=2024551 RepID=UPI001BD05C84|nr:hypothetical protein [Thiocapsa sp.]QVL47863.1 MAG: hypothetical protein KFB96_19635 [Thiocapsa sp.]